MQTDKLYIDGAWVPSTGTGTIDVYDSTDGSVMGTIPDDMAGIFQALKEAALTMQQGGGIGYDFSTLRPKGAPVKGVGADASGPLSFMKALEAMYRTIMSAGYHHGVWQSQTYQPLDAW